jgi:putative ABC transport system permease protein
VDIGDRITWDVGGVRIETQVANLRRVEWARFQLNFFAVFESGVLERAPQMFVLLTRITDATQRATFERALVSKYPNISSIDLAMIQQTVDSIIRKISLAIRFMAAFSIAGGLIILIGAISTSKFQRMRECVLLKTLGAGSRQIFQILCTEYFAIGALAAMTGTLLAGIAGWALTTFVFEMPFELPVGALALIWFALTALTMTVGLLNSRDVVRKPPLVVIRELAE